MEQSPAILITGGLGFIGLHVAQSLHNHGASLVLMDNLSTQIHGAVPQLSSSLFESSRVKVIRGDVRIRRDWRAALEGVDQVIHLAAETGTAQSMYEIEHYTSVNVGGTSLMFDILANEKHHVRKVVIASSRSVYGEGAYDCRKCGRVYPEMRSESSLEVRDWDPKCRTCGATLQAVPTPEDAKIRPASIYAATKFAQEELSRISGVALGIATVILRFQNVYGEGQSLKNPYTGILSIFSNRIRQGKPIFLFEDGLESRDFVHVADVANALTRALFDSKADGMTFNVGSGVRISVEVIAKMLKRHLGDPSEPIVSGEYRIGDIRHCFADLTKISDTVGFRPSVSLDAGLERFLRWVKTQPIERDGLESANRQLAERGLMAQTAPC